MTESQVAWLLAIAGGAVIAIVYFASLWWTVTRVARASHPVWLVAVSFLLRGLLAAALLVGVAGGDPWRLLAAIGTFLLVRTLVVRMARTAGPSSHTPGNGSA